MSVARQHKTGRKRKRSPVRIAHRFGDQEFQKLLGGINKGLTIQMAAKATGFARSVVYDYLARNPDKQDVLKRQCKVSWLSKLEELANASGDWPNSLHVDSSGTNSVASGWNWILPGTPQTLGARLELGNQ